MKEYYFYVDNVPTHSYQRYLYKYPHAAFPYEELVRVNAERSRLEPEFELIDTGVFADGRYFDVEVEYAKASPDDILVLHHRAQPWPGRRADPSAAHPVVPQWLVLATERSPTLAGGGRRAGAG